jgi:hypothetical protein
MSSSESDDERFVRGALEEVSEKWRAPCVCFSSQKFLWEAYQKYVYAHASKSKGSYSYREYLMTPGLFCQYLSIMFIRAQRNGSLPTLNTIDEVIDDLSKPNVRYQSDPCGPFGYMQVFEDEDGDTPPILDWGRD